MMSFQEAAEYVAEDFANTMKEEGFKTFKEMSRHYCWEPEDIRQEIDAILSGTDAWLWDDGTHVQIGIDDMYYRDFKKMVLLKIVEILK